MKTRRKREKEEERKSQIEREKSKYRKIEGDRKRAKNKMETREKKFQPKRDR